MRLDLPDALTQPRQLDAVPDNRVMVLHHGQPQFAQPGGEIVDLSPVLIGDRRKLIESAIMRRKHSCHFGQELVDRREVNAVAALHAVTLPPQPPSRNGDASTFARAASLHQPVYCKIVSPSLTSVTYISPSGAT
ncbi:MAG TPA: hypothetical protein VJR70_04285 [Stellaceae bacterium]|nr:hypothetical protein [Stellaceae bacterium]